MIEATALPAAWQVRFRAGDNEGRADTVKDGIGASRECGRMSCWKQCWPHA